MSDYPLEFHFELLQPDTDPSGKIICLAERDNVFHVETKIRGRFFSAHFDTGVRFIDALDHQGDPKFWDIVVMPDLSTQEIEDFAESICGSKYDFFGAFNSAMGIPQRDPNKWFCSLCAEEIASRADILGLTPLPSPSILRHELKKRIDAVTQTQGDADGFAPHPVDGLYMNDEMFAHISTLVDENKIDPSFSAKLIEHCSNNS